MNQFFHKNKQIIAGLAACLFIGGVTMSFQNTPFGPLDKLEIFTDIQDTIPEKMNDEDAKMSIRDFDLLMQNMDNQSLKMQDEISKIDFDKIHKEISASLDRVDFDKIKMDIDIAMREIDLVKIEKGVKAALKELEWNKINNDVKVSLQEAKKEIEKINMEDVKKEMEKAKLEIEKSRKEIKKINIDEIMKNANEGISKAKEELRLTKSMFNQMENDGLINQKDGFTIEYQDKNLYINGKKQTEAIKGKYRPYIKGETYKISISRE